MKIHRSLLLAGLIAAGTAFAHDGGSNPGSNIMFVFDGALPMQPLRPGANGLTNNNTVAGVTAAGAPWDMKAFQAVVRAGGEFRAHGSGVLLLGTDNIGTRGGPRQVILSLFCRNAPVAPSVIGTVNPNAFNSQPTDLDEDGDFSVRGWLADSTGAAPPANCGDSVDNRPVFLVRAVVAANPTTGAPAAPGSWFAAGIIADRHGGHDRW
jgi:hypothetical protein